MAFLTKDQILQAQDLEREVVEVPAWGGSLYIRALTGRERDRFEESISIRKTQGKKTTADVSMDNIRAKLVALTACGEDGARLFTDADVKSLGDKSAEALQRCFDVAMKLSGMKPEEVEELGNASADGQSDEPTSDSALPPAALTLVKP